jgi:cystathionine beta-lyase/cystathionine gamma-synthase
LQQPNPTSWKLDTLLVHGGRIHGAGQRSSMPTVPPIYASTTYIHPDAEALDHAFDDPPSAAEPAYVYARQRNPGAHALETALAQVEGGIGAVVCGSGMAAIHTALLAAGLAPGARILASQDLYGVTTSLFRKIFQPFGITVILRNLSAPDAADHIRSTQPDVVYVETLSNPLIKVTDLPAISAAARAAGAVSIVDSTFTTPYLVRPLAYGFDLVVHSATKYLGGHGDSTGGVVVSARQTLLDQLRFYSKTVGAMLSPFEAHLILRGLRTLALRMERHCRNALHVAHFLQQHSAVERVHYPGLPGHPQHALATSLFRGECYGGVLAFELKAQSRAAAARFMDHLRLCLPVTTLGDVYSEVSYPAISSHRTLTDGERQQCGITAGCIRVSVGIEDIEDIIQDLDQALAS